MNPLIATAIGTVVFVIIIIITKSVWQWLIGTDELIEQSKAQTKELSRLNDNIEQLIIQTKEGGGS